MENIHEPTNDFQFDTLIFITPVPVAGGNHFIRCFSNKQQKPLYLQPPKCKIKSGIVKAGKKMYCDLIFTQDDEQFIEWLDNFESLCQTRIFDNREKWFESTLEKHDIENSFSPSIKLYKAGKQYTMRVNIPTRLGKSTLKVYNEQEEDISMDNLKEGNSVITILEFQGIKCSSRNFQLEIEAKQMMLLNDVNIFDACVFKKKPSTNPVNVQITTPTIIETVTVPNTNSQKDNEVIVETVEEDNIVPEEVTENIEDKIEIDLENFEESKALASETEIMEKKKDILPDNTETHETKPNELVEPNDDEDMCEVDLSYEEVKDEEVKIKEQSDIYYNMYRDAKQKAIMARDMALAHYLETKRIKNLYTLDESILNDDEQNIENMEKDLEFDFDIVTPSSEVK
jgi:hypothetical protein